MVWAMMGSSPPSSANFPKVLSFSAKLVLSCMRFWPSDTTTSDVEELVHICCCTTEVVCVYGAREGHGVTAMPALVRSNRSRSARAALYGLLATSVKPAGCLG